MSLFAFISAITTTYATKYVPQFAKESVCPLHYMSIDGVCIKVWFETVDWYHAKMNCEKRQAHLIEITSQNQLDLLEKKLTENGFYWVNNMTQSCDSMKSNTLDGDYSWTLNKKKFTIISHKLYPEVKGTCCLSFYPHSMRKAKFMWMPCDSPSHYICAIAQDEVSESMLQETLTATIEKCKNSIANSTEFERNIEHLERILDRLSTFHSHGSIYIVVSMIVFLVLLLYLYLIWKYYHDRKYLNDFEIKDPNSYETVSNLYVPYDQSVTVMNRCESS